MHGHEQHSAGIDQLGEQSPILLNPPTWAHPWLPNLAASFLSSSSARAVSSSVAQGMPPSRKACLHVLAQYATWSRAFALLPNFFLHTGSTVARLNGLWYLASMLLADQRARRVATSPLVSGHSMHTNSCGFVRSILSLACVAHTGFFGLVHLMSSAPLFLPGSREVSSMAQDDTDRAFSAGTRRPRAPISGLHGAFLPFRCSSWPASAQFSEWTQAFSQSHSSHSHVVDFLAVAWSIVRRKMSTPKLRRYMRQEHANCVRRWIAMWGGWGQLVIFCKSAVCLRFRIVGEILCLVSNRPTVCI